MAKKIDPLNKKNYPAVTANLVVGDVKAAMNFYQKAFGFKKILAMNGPGGMIMHAELRLRDSVVMLSPERPEAGQKGAKALGGTPATLYLLVENADKTFAKAVQLGGHAVMPVADMFWGDRCGILADPEGNAWMIATHKSEPTPQEMKKAMAAMAQQQPAAVGA